MEMIVLQYKTSDFYCHLQKVTGKTFFIRGFSSDHQRPSKYLDGGQSIRKAFNSDNGRVPTRTGKPGKPGKMGRHFPVREKSGNFEQTGKVREKSGEITQNTGKLR